MLTDVGCGNQNLSERDRVVWQEVELQKVLGVGIVVNDTCDVDNETDRLGRISQRESIRI
jgi:hypothetical protein